MSRITNNLEINAYLHCGKCLDELPDGVTPADYSNTQAGFTDQGLQVWCNRHNCNIVNIDFEGNQHPADNTVEK